MPAYLIANIRVTDPARYEEYKTMAARSIAAFGGRYVVRGGAVEVLEGGWTPPRLVVLEFPDRARALAWWHSEEYQAAKSVRQASAAADMVLVDGL